MDPSVASMVTSLGRCSSSRPSITAPSDLDRLSASLRRCFSKHTATVMTISIANSQAHTLLLCMSSLRQW